MLPQCASAKRAGRELPQAYSPHEPGILGEFDR
jgi:hypothetical protein